MKRKKIEKLLHEACDILSESDNTIELFSTEHDVKVNAKLSEKEKMAFVVAIASVSAIVSDEAKDKTFTPDSFVKTMITAYAIIRKDIQEDDC